MKKNYFKVIPAVHLFLFDEQGRVLLLRRFQTGYEDGSFSVPAGHVEAKEQPLAAMQRETAEEIGLNLAQTAFKFAHIMARREANEERADFFFTAQLPVGKKPKINEPEKCDQLLWVNVESLPINMVAYIQSAILAVQAKKSL